MNNPVGLYSARTHSVLFPLSKLLVTQIETNSRERGKGKHQQAGNNVSYTAPWIYYLVSLPNIPSLLKSGQARYHTCICTMWSAGGVIGHQTSLIRLEANSIYGVWIVAKCLSWLEQVDDRKNGEQKSTFIVAPKTIQ